MDTIFGAFLIRSDYTLDYIRAILVLQLRNLLMIEYQYFLVNFFANIDKNLSLHPISKDLKLGVVAQLVRARDS
jgi:hypothetical protein